MLQRYPTLLLLSVFAALAAWNLFSGHGLDSDLGGDPDEPAHAVTSLMVRDYLAGGFIQPPMDFAKRYYADFPKVALGHYPPGYYLLGGLALLVWPEPETLIILQSLLAIAIAWVTARLGQEVLGRHAQVGLFAGALTLVLPIMVKTQALVMADLLLTLLVALAVWAWATFLERPTARRALLFGCLGAAAILTKGSGLLLGAVPVISVVLLRRWALFKDWRWWLAGVPVGLLAVPWMLATAKITREGMVETTLPDFIREAVPFYLTELPISCGLLLTVFLVLGLGIQLVRTARQSLTTTEATLLGVLIGGAAILVLVPAGLTTRYFAPLVPAFVIFAALGCHRAAGFVFQKQPYALVPLLALFSLFMITKASHQPLPKSVHGFATAVEHALPMLKATPETQAHWLVSSDPRGEGAIIAETAFRLPQRSPSPLRLHRASKDIASSDWLGRGYETAFKSDADLLTRLDALGITTVFLDESMREDKRAPHHAQLLKALNSAPERWQLTETVPIARSTWEGGEMKVFVAR